MKQEEIVKFSGGNIPVVEAARIKKRATDDIVVRRKICYTRKNYSCSKMYLFQNLHR